MFQAFEWSVFVSPQYWDPVFKNYPREWKKLPIGRRCSLVSSQWSCCRPKTGTWASTPSTSSVPSTTRCSTSVRQSWPADYDSTLPDFVVVVEQGCQTQRSHWKFLSCWHFLFCSFSVSFSFLLLWLNLLLRCPNCQPMWTQKQQDW